MTNTRRSFPRAAKAALALLLCLATSACARQAGPQIVAQEPVAPVETPAPALAPQADDGVTLVAPAVPDDPGTAFIVAPGAPDAEGNFADDFTGESYETIPEADIKVGMVAGVGANVHPLKCVYRDIISMNELVFESLIELDDNMQPAPLLSDTWTVSGSVYTFHLRQNVVFHNGQPLTADDVVATYNYIKSSGSISPWNDRLSIVESMSANADGTLGVRFANGGYAALYAMTFPVVQRNSLDYALPMGTGPYWYNAYAQDSYLRVESNPLWWKKTARTQSIMAVRYNTTGDALQALLTGEIDALATRSAQASLYRKLSDFTTYDYSTYAYEMLVPNLNNGAMTDLRVRRAVMYAIDRTAVADTVYGSVVQQSEVPVVPGSWLYETRAAQYNYSPERALQLLYDIGWEDSNGDGMLDVEVDGLLENFKLTLVTYNDNISENRTDAAGIIASQLKKVGVEVEIVKGTRDRMAEVFRSGKFDLALVCVNLAFVPDLSALLYHNGARNYSGYADKDMDNLILSARSAPSADEFGAIYSEIQMKIVEELPIMGMYFHTGTVISALNLRACHATYETNTWNGMELVQLE